MSKHDNQKAHGISEIWDRCNRKLVVYIQDASSLTRLKTGQAVGLEQTKEPLQLACRVIFTGQDKEIKQKKTKPVVVSNGNCTWNEMVFLDLDGVDTSLEITLEVIENVRGMVTHIKKTPLIGAARLMPIEQLAPETVISNIAELQLSKGKKEVKKTGIVNVVMYLSESKESTGKPPEGLHYYYEPHKKNLKTGDLLLYTETGLLSTMAKLSRNSIHNRAGIVMKMPNKYTHKEELFVFEVTRNTEKYADVWNEQSQAGLNIFRLWERVHHVPGFDVFWCPLKQPLQFDQANNLIDWIHKIHGGKIGVSSFFQPIPRVCKELLLTFGLDIEKEENVQLREDLKEFQSTDLILEALRVGGIRVPSDEEVFVEDLLQLEAFGEPVPLRVPTKLSDKKEMTWLNIDVSAKE